MLLRRIFSATIFHGAQVSWVAVLRGWPHCTGLQQVEWLDFIGPHDCSKTACRPTLLRLPLGSSGLCALLLDANTPYFRASTSTSMCDMATAASVCGISVRLHYYSLPLFGNRLDATFINLPGRSSLTDGIQHVSATMACPNSFIICRAGLH